MRRWEQAYLPQIRHLIAITGAIADYVAARNPSLTVHRINNPLDPVFFGAASRDREGSVILFVGQLSRRKGVDLLLKAFEEVARQCPGVELRIVGGDQQDPVYAAELRARAAGISAARITFVGALSRPDIAREMANASLLCLPSRYEASPLVVVEAMAVGTPVVATDVGDVSELLAGGIGITTPPDDAEALASAMTRLLSNPRERARMGERAREAAWRRANPDRIAAETAAVLRMIATGADGSLDRSPI
jgi:glycosyltransferase involved in cell wall biosynthesis